MRFLANPFNRRPLLALLIIAIYSCVPEVPPETFIVVEKAEHLYLHKQSGYQQIYYTVDSTFPARPITEAIYRDVTTHGWAPLHFDHLNPEISGSHVDGWQDYVDASGKKEIRRYQWMADWQNKDKDILRYAFVFTAPVDSTAPTPSLQVAAWYFPHNTILVNGFVTKVMSWLRLGP